jgi:hypothetical protein
VAIKLAYSCYFNRFSGLVNGASGHSICDLLLQISIMPAKINIEFQMFISEISISAVSK